MIELIKPNKPDHDLLMKFLHGLEERGHYTNHGPLVAQLEGELSRFTAHESMLYVANGTLALQLALKKLAKKEEVLTTPYSYVATTNAALWQNHTVRFVDLIKDDFFPDPEVLEGMITSRTGAILLTSVYGLPGPVESYFAIAKKHNIPLILDAAHAFGVKWKGDYLDRWCDMACYSFHATKTFHTVEGGGIAISGHNQTEELINLRSFGHRGDIYYGEGINAKGSEVHAAYGLAQLGLLQDLLTARQRIFEVYHAAFKGLPLKLLAVPAGLEWNFGYYPIVLTSGSQRERFQAFMLGEGIRTRRYFYPSLNTLPHLEEFQSCPNSEDLANRVVCIPLHAQLTEDQVEHIIQSVIKGIG
jgi:dTDP-4-amino-4,6-dideoxygalactose transaminase